MTTVNDVVIQALRKSGIIGLGQAPDASDTGDALSDLIDMLAQWNQKRWLIWDLIELSKVSTGATSYSVGPGADFNVGANTRAPIRLEYAFLRQIVTGGLPVDYPLKLIPSREEYALVALKSLTSFAQAAFLDSGLPNATLYLFPNPNATIYEIHIGLKNAYPTNLALNTSLANVPPEAIPAMKFVLARRLRQAYGKGLRPDPELNALAKEALDTLRDANIQVPELRLPGELLRPGLYNVLGDTYYVLPWLAIGIMSLYTMFGNVVTLFS